MTPQISKDSYVHPRVLGDGSVPLPCVANGRLSDQSVLIPVLTKLEHVANPISEEDQQVVKCSRDEGDEVMDVSEDGTDGLNQGSVVVDGVVGMVCNERAVHVKGGEGHVKPSFRDMLTGRRSESLTAHVIPELDVEIDDEDVRISSSDVYTMNKSISGVDVRATSSVKNKVGSMEKYGPWMIASGRKSRMASWGMTVDDYVAISSKQVAVSAGKFDVLANLTFDIDAIEETVDPPAFSTTILEANTLSLVTNVPNREVIKNDKSLMVGELPNGDKRNFLQGSSSTRMASPMSEHENTGVDKVVSSEMVVPVQVSLDLKAHVVVRVVETGRGEKGDQIRKKASGCSSSKVQLGEWIGGLEAEILDNGGEKPISALVGDDLPKKPEASVQWHSQSPDILALSEPRVWGHKADRLESIRSCSVYGFLTDQEFLLSFVYASPNKQKRNGLWCSLDALCPDNGMAWVLEGDFNAITSSSERMGGSCREDGVSANFNEFLQLTVLHLSQFGLDHRSVLLVTDLAHAAFGKHGLEKVNERSLVPLLTELEAKLKDELSKTLGQEEVLWFQRARTDWIKDGDRNTKYCHRISKAKQRQNLCLVLKIENGQWCSDQPLIRRKVVEFFKTVFYPPRSGVGIFMGNFHLYLHR
ncbi:hypothetical protein V6N13_063661 [Hibiscus sabdariffa]